MAKSMGFQKAKLMATLTDYQMGSQKDCQMVNWMAMSLANRTAKCLEIQTAKQTVSPRSAMRSGCSTVNRTGCLKDCLMATRMDCLRVIRSEKCSVSLTVTRSVTLRACLLTVMRLVNWKGNHWAMLMDFDLVIHLDCLKDSHSVIQKVTLKVFPQMVKHWVNHLVTHWVNHLDLLKVYPLKAMRWGYQMDFQMAKLTVKTMV